MNENLSNQLAALAAKLNVSVDALYAALLKQAFISGLCDILFYVLVVCAAFGMVWFWKWCVSKDKEQVHYDDNGRYVVFCVCAVVLAGLILCSLLGLSTTLAAFFNPDYWALHQIMGMGKR